VVAIKWGKKITVSAIASAILVLPGNFDPKKGAIDTMGAIRMSPKRKIFKIDIGGRLGKLRTKER
jgi:hypothetical protein